MEGSRNRLHPHKYEQLCKSLLDLEAAAETIFDAILSRVTVQRQQLNALKSRIQSAQAKVNAITGTNRATTIYSNSKYPIILPEAEDFVSLFGGKRAGDPSHFPIATISLSTGQCQKGREGTLELFHFFTETNYELCPNMKVIGGLPANVKSVSDAILFNSTELPYIKFKIVDNLAGADHQSVEDVSRKPFILPDPPQSVLGRHDEAHMGPNDFGFRPVLREVPSMSLPSVLPELAMVAEISWSGPMFGANQLPSIAPSAFQSGLQKYSMKATLDRSPPLDSLTDSNEDILSVASVSVNNTELQRSSTLYEEESIHIPIKDVNDSLFMSTKTVQVGQKTPVALPPPPPPPPLPPAPTIQKTATVADMSGSLKETIALRAAATQNIAIPDAGSQEKFLSPAPSSTAQSLPLIDPQRAALLASIRHHSFNLRKTGLVQEHGKDSSQSFMKENQGVKGTEHYASSSRQRPPVDILADMATTLKMRRLSMQGAAHDKVAFKSGTGMGMTEGPISASASSSRLQIFMLTLQRRMRNLVMMNGMSRDLISDDLSCCIIFSQECMQRYPSK